MVIHRLKKVFGKSDPIARHELDRLKKLPAGEREHNVETLLYEIAFQNAASFVHYELKKGDSVFSGLERDAFFQEILMMNFWMMDKVFAKHMERVAGKMHFHYFGTLSDYKERSAALDSRFKIYNLCWDEYTGHHDEFGLKAGEIIFGEGAVYHEKSVSFWVITYTDDSIKKLKKIRAQFIENGLIQRKENDNE